MDLTDILDSNTDMDDLDTQVAMSAVMLKKLATQEGVDLSQFSENELANMYDELRGFNAGAETNNSREKVAMTTENEITYAQVATEMAKVAAANDVDLSALSKEEQAEFFDKIAEAMQTEEYWAEQEAGEQFQKRAAEASELGEIMAQSHALKLAELLGLELVEPEKVADSGLHRGSSAKDHGNISSVMGPKPTGKEKALSAPGVRHAGEAVAAADRGLKGLNKRLGGRTHGRGRALAALGAGTAAAAGAAVGAKKLFGKKKESQAVDIEAEALKLASEFLIENGIDPETGEALAAEKVAEVAEQAVQDRALELLRERGYNV